MDNADMSLIEVGQSSQLIYDGHLVKLYNDMVRLPNGKLTGREWIKHPGASAVLPLLPDGRVILVRQYRYPVHQVTLEVPAGKLDEGEAPLACAVRELAEETGYTARTLTKLTTIATTVGFTNEVIHIYVAHDLQAGEQHCDADEFVNVVTMPLSEALAKVKDGSISDAKTVVALLAAQNWGA